MSEAIKIQIVTPGVGHVHDNQAVVGNYLPSGGFEYAGCVFLIGDVVDNPDYLIVIDDFDVPITTECARESIYYLNSETMIEPDFVSEGSEMFLNQFGSVVSPHAMYIPHVSNALPFQPWMIHCGYHKGLFSKSAVDYDFLANNKFPKTKLLSVVASDKGSHHRAHLNHRKRYRFLKALKEFFGDRIDIYGKGFNELDCKLEGLADYQYTVVLENQSTYNIVTEKLYDAFLAECYPLYYGAPNVHTIFGPDSCTVINIDDVHGSLRIIDQTIRSGARERALSAIAAAKDITLNKCNWLIRIAEICREAEARKAGQPRSSNANPITLMPRSHFLKQSEKTRRLNKIRNKMLRLVGRSTSLAGGN